MRKRGRKLHIATQVTSPTFFLGGDTRRGLALIYPINI